MQLNKFSVVAHHFLMITRGASAPLPLALRLNIEKPSEYESQASPLMPGDLAHAYMVLAAARNAGKSMFAFYNCEHVNGFCLGAQRVTG